MHYLHWWALSPKVGLLDKWKENVFLHFQNFKSLVKKSIGEKIYIVSQKDLIGLQRLDWCPGGPMQIYFKDHITIKLAQKTRVSCANEAHASAVCRLIVGWRTSSQTTWSRQAWTILESAWPMFAWSMSLTRNGSKPSLLSTCWYDKFELEG